MTYNKEMVQRANQANGTENSAVEPVDLEIEYRETKKFISRIRDGFSTLTTALLNGIPLELAFIVDPETKNRIMVEFRAKNSAGSFTIKEQAHIMIGLLDANFPHLDKGSQQWMFVRSYFIGKIGLWGKTC